MNELQLLIGKHYSGDDGWEVYAAHPEGGYVALFYGTEQECEEFVASRSGPAATVAPDRPDIVITHAQWVELQEMHSPTTVSDGAILRTGPCAICKDPGEGNWCATYQWLVRIATSDRRKEYQRVKQAADAILDALDTVTGSPWDDLGARDAINELSTALNRQSVGEDA